MRTSKRPAYASLFSILLLPAMVAAITINCEHTRVKRKDFNLSPLSGPHLVNSTTDLGQSFEVTTYTIDICKPLYVTSEKGCPNGTRVCGIRRLISTIENTTTIEAIMPIAGELANRGGPAYGLDPAWTLLSQSEASADIGLEGLRLTMKGGWFTTASGDRDQQAIIELICDREREGNEGEMAPNSEPVAKPEGNAETSMEPSLTFVDYPGTNDKVDTLRLKWKTKYACEDQKDETDAAQKSSWGFFTWFFFVAFLGTAAYLIFGSWLNYTRYGARGWDLLPHGDAIRDVPYLMKDWTRKVVNTVQGGGSRGGYAAV